MAAVVLGGLFWYNGSTSLTSMHRPIPPELQEYVSIADTPSGLVWIKKPSSKVLVGDTAGNLDRHHGYWVLRFRGAGYRVHRVVCYLQTGEDHPDLEVAHANGVRTDNRPENLRWATRSENELDKPVRGEVPFRNVFIYKGAFTAMWRVPLGDKRYCGRYPTAEQARDAVIADQNWYHNNVQELPHLSLRGELHSSKQES